MTPEQEARAAAERDPSPRYDDGRPKMHRHFAEFAVHLDEECDRPSTRRRVYLFDTDELEAHEAWIAERAEARITELEASVSGVSVMWSKKFTDMEGRALRAEAEVREYRSAICFEVTCLNCAKLLDKLASAEAALADLRGGATTVEIGGQVMTQAQFDAARYPLLHPNPGPTAPGGTGNDRPTLSPGSRPTHGKGSNLPPAPLAKEPSE